MVASYTHNFVIWRGKRARRARRMSLTILADHDSKTTKETRVQHERTGCHVELGGESPHTLHYGVPNKGKGACPARLRAICACAKKKPCARKL